MLYECYLGVRPLWALFKHILWVKAQPNKETPHYVGGCNIQVNTRTPYFTMRFLDSAIGWRSRWFYAKGTPSGIDAPIVDLNQRVVQRASWKNLLTLEEKA